MFKPSLFKKLFIVLLFSMLISSGVILLSVHYSFSKGFGDYLLQAEASQLDKLVGLLEQHYAQEGDWQVFQGNRRAWFGVLRHGLENQHLPPDIAHPLPPEPDDATTSSHPPSDRNDDFPEHHRTPSEKHRAHRFFEWRKRSHRPPDVLSRFLGSRLQLQDTQHHKIVGFQSSSDQAIVRPLKQGAAIVGWLALQPSDLITDHLAELFVKQQIRNNYLIAAVALALAMLGALLLSRKLVIPIKRIAAGTKALVTGDYTTQINVASRDELGQLATDFNELSRTLASNESARKQWLVDISHELRTPLAILRGEIEAVQDGVRELTPEHLQSLHAEVIHLTQLVDDLYQLSLSDAGNALYQFEQVNVSECLADIVDNFQPRFNSKSLALKLLHPAGRTIIIQADLQRLRQLFVNLLENSYRYTHSGGLCNVKLNCSGPHVHIIIEDTPPAVPDAALGKLFDRLYRVDPSRNRELGGAGLGLAICKAIVNAHQGTISAYHAATGGLGIKISLPLNFNASTHHHAPV